MDLEVEIEEPEGEKDVEDSETLLEELKRLFDRMVLTTRVEAESGNVHLNGEGWRVEIRGEDEIVFKPAGGTLSLARRMQDVTMVEARDHRVRFRFGDTEEITVSRGIEQRLLYD